MQEPVTVITIPTEPVVLSACAAGIIAPNNAAIAAEIKTRDLKGEVVLVVGPAAAVEVTDEDISVKLDAALQSMSLKDAAKAVSDALGVAKTRVYDIGLKLKERS